MLRNKQRIVLVEDNPGDAFAAWEHLTEARLATVQVDVVPTLAETLALLAQGPVDAIVLNLQLPDSKGLDTLRRVRRAAGQAAIIVLTDHVDEALRAHALAHGAEEIHDKCDTHDGLFSHSVRYVVERNRAHLQHARLQALLDTLPDAIVVADDGGTVRFANAAAWQLFGQDDAGMLDVHLDFSAPDGEAVSLAVHRDKHLRNCELRVVPIEWEGRAARLASVQTLPGSTPVAATPNRGPTSAGDARGAGQAARLMQDILSSLSLQIRAQMHAFSGLSDRLEHTASDPLQSCYQDSLQQPDDSFLSALYSVADSLPAFGDRHQSSLTPMSLTSRPHLATSLSI